MITALRIHQSAAGAAPNLKLRTHQLVARGYAFQSARGLLSSILPSTRFVSSSSPVALALAATACVIGYASNETSCGANINGREAGFAWKKLLFGEVPSSAFRRAWEAGDLAALQKVDCSRLVSRVVVKTEEQFAAQLSKKEGTKLNSKQCVFVTPASSWIDLLEAAKKGGRNATVRAADALDFVGWDRETITRAQDEKLIAQLWVWSEGGEVTAREAATWDFVFDSVLPACAKGAAIFVPPGGLPKPKAWYVHRSKKSCIAFEMESPALTHYAFVWAM